MMPLRPLPALALFCAAVFCLSTAAHSADKPAPSPTPAPTGPADLAPIGPASPEVLADVAAHAKTADDLWAYIQKYRGTEDLEAIDPELDEETRMSKVRELVRDKVTHLRPAVDEMLKRYPQDPRRWEARLLRVNFQQESNAITDVEADKALHEIADASDAPTDIKRQARSALLEESLQKASEITGLTPDLEAQMTAYEKDFPDDPLGEQLVELRLKMLQLTPDKINGELTALAKSPNQATAKAAAQELVMRTQPLDFKFAGLDGKEIDFAKLRGKVVLIDCWATWCVGCIMMLPDLQMINKKYADKDFQIIGVSLDDDRVDVASFVKAQDVAWPQYFDGKVFKTLISARLGVTALPATFLVDRQGIVHRVDPQADLDVEVGKMLVADGSGKK